MDKFRQNYRFVEVFWFFGEIPQLERKAWLKKKLDVIFHFLFIYHTLKNSAHSKTIKNAKKLSVSGKNNFRRLSISYKFIFFETLIIFPEPTTKLITGIFDWQK